MIDLKDVATALRQPTPLPVTCAIDSLPSSGTDAFMDEYSTLSSENKRTVEYLYHDDLDELPNDQRPDCHRDITSYRSVYGRMYGE